MTSAAVDWGFEDRLIDYIGLKEACAKVLDQRQRKVLFARLAGATLREVAREIGRSPGQADQIENRICEKLAAPHLGLARSRPLPLPPTAAVTTQKTVPGFDRAAFLAHMQKLIELRETAKQRRFDREHRRLQELFDQEGGSWRLARAADNSRQAELFDADARAQIEADRARKAAERHAQYGLGSQSFSIVGGVEAWRKKATAWVKSFPPSQRLERIARARAATHEFARPLWDELIPELGL